jgi:hypothetical protein
MCNPMAAFAVMAVVSAAGTAYSQHAAAEQADKKEQFLKKQASQQVVAAEAAKEIDLDALDQRVIEEDQKTDIDIMDREKQARREQAMMRVSAAEAGILGNTVDRQLLSSALGASWDVGIIQENNENAMAQIALNERAVGANFQSRKNQASNTATEANLIRKAQPNAAFNALQIFGSGASGGAGGYTAGKNLTDSFGNTPAPTNFSDPYGH